MMKNAKEILMVTIRRCFRTHFVTLTILSCLIFKCFMREVIFYFIFLKKRERKDRLKALDGREMLGFSWTMRSGEGWCTLAGGPKGASMSFDHQNEVEGGERLFFKTGLLSDVKVI